MSEDSERAACLVECYWPGVTGQKLLAALERLQAVVDQRRAHGSSPRLLGSILVPVDETVFWLIEGEHDEVETLSTAAELAFDRILGSRWIDATRRFGNEKHA